MADQGLLTWAVTAVLSAIVAYFTTISTLAIRLSMLEEREENHYKEVLRRLDSIDRKLG